MQGDVHVVLCWLGLSVQYMPDVLSDGWLVDGQYVFPHGYLGLADS